MSESQSTRRKPVTLETFLQVHAEAVALGKGRSYIAEVTGMTEDSVSSRISTLKSQKGIVLDPLVSSQGRTARTPDEIRDMIADIKAGLEADAEDNQDA